MAPKIIQEILIAGAQAKKELDDIGLAGQRAFSQLKSGASAVNLSPLEQTAKRLGISVADFKARTQNFVSGAADVSSASKAATGSVGSFGVALRQLGRATGERELSKLGRVIAVLSGRFRGLALPAIALGLGILANSAANAADKIGDGAQEANLSTDAFQSYTDAGISAGISSSKMGESISKLQTALKKTVHDTDAAAEAQIIFKQNLSDAKDAAGAAVPNYAKLREEGRQLALSWAKGAISQADFDAGQLKIKEGMQSTSDAISKGDETVRRLIDSNRRSKIAALEAGTELEKLGISGSEAARLLKNPNEMLDVLAQKAQGGAIPIEQLRAVLNEIGQDRRLIPFLNEGAAGIARMRAESEQLAPKLTDVQLAIGDKFSGSISKLIEVLINLKNQIGLAFAPAFGSMIDGLANRIAAARPQIIAFAEGFGNVLLPILQGVGTFIAAVIIPIFNGWVFILQTVASAINNTFGAGTTSALKIFMSVLLALAIAFGGPVVVITAVAAAIGLLIEKFGGLETIWNNVLTAMTKIGNDFVTWFMSTWVGTIIKGIQLVIVKLKELVEWWNRSKASAGPDSSKTEQFGPSRDGMASGGRVRGPGTGTSDSIPAWLSHGEYVARAAAVRKYGVGIFNALNSLQLPKNFLQGFADGGLASLNIKMPQPLRMARGGMVPTRSQLRPLSLTIGADTFAGLLAPEDVAEKLMHVSTNKRIRSAGRKPTYYGAR
jgi:hypothetical protein